MRIARVSSGGMVDFAVGVDGGWVLLGAVGISCPDTGSLFGHLDDIRAAASTGPVTAAADVRLRNPIIRPNKVLGVGHNYRDLLELMGREPLERPLLFAKLANSLVGPDEPIVVDATLTQEADWEVELAVVIGSRVRSVTEREARSAVGGYLVANDVTARDVQRVEPQLARAKGFDTFCPVGPWITTADEVADPEALHLSARLNDEVVQDDSTEQLAFGVDALISYLSATMTLEPGDVLLTGTPPGFGNMRDPKRFLVPGDVIVCEVEGLGSITNRVVSARAAVVGQDRSTTLSRTRNDRV